MAKGRIAITGTLGFDINYARVFQTPTGRKIRIVTDRPITFGEARTSYISGSKGNQRRQRTVAAATIGAGLKQAAVKLKLRILH